MVSKLFNTATKEDFLDALIYFFNKVQTFGAEQKVIFKDVMSFYIHDLHLIENFVQRFSELHPVSIRPKISESAKKLGTEFKDPFNDFEKKHNLGNKYLQIFHIFMRKTMNCVEKGLFDANFLKGYSHAEKTNIIWDLLSQLSNSPWFYNWWFKLVPLGQTFRCFEDKNEWPLDICGVAYHRAKNLDTGKEFFYIEEAKGNKKDSAQMKDRTHLFEPILTNVSEYYGGDIEYIWVFENMNYFQNVIPNIPSSNQIFNIYEGIVKMIEHFNNQGVRLTSFDINNLVFIPTNDVSLDAIFDDGRNFIVGYNPLKGDMRMSYTCDASPEHQRGKTCKESWYYYLGLVLRALLKLATGSDLSKEEPVDGLMSSDLKIRSKAYHDKMTQEKFEALVKRK